MWSVEHGGWHIKSSPNLMADISFGIAIIIIKYSQGSFHWAGNIRTECSELGRKSKNLPLWKGQLAFQAEEGTWAKIQDQEKPCCEFLRKYEQLKWLESRDMVWVREMVLDREEHCPECECWTSHCEQHIAIKNVHVAKYYDQMIKSIF